MRESLQFLGFAVLVLTDRPSRAEWGVPGDDLEGVVAVEKGRPVAHGDDRDQTVDRAADRLSPGAAVAVEGGGGLVVGQPSDRQELEAQEQAAQPGHLLGGGHPGEQLHGHDLGGGQLPVGGDQLPQAEMGGAAGRAQVLDPGRGVGQDHDPAVASVGQAVASASRMAPRSPLQPMPSMASASSRFIGSPASRLRASSTAARLLGSR
jgi:hypothetical protein